MKILLAVDGSAFTKKMLAYVTTHPELFGTDNDFTVLTVQPPLPPRARAMVGKEAVDGYYAEESQKVLDPVMKFLQRHSLKVRGAVKVGHAAEVIAKTAETGKYDMLIMGSHGHGSRANLVMGSVATKVLAHSTVPLLLVR